ARGAQLVEGLADQRRQLLGVADRLEPDLVVEDLAALADQELAEKLHQAGDLVRRARPVLRAERVERQRFEAELSRGACDVADAVGAGTVALEAEQSAGLGPA